MNLPMSVRLLLWPLSLLYGGIVRTRVWMYGRGWLKQRRLKAPVISVGNLTVGGTGKTPMVIWLAEKFLREGKRVAILSRGYRGTNGTSDEIELMKFRLQDRVTFGVGKDRFAEGSRIESREPVDVFLLDDGFQHLALSRNMDILLMDASRPLGNEFLLPAGRLREPVSAMARANLLVITRSETVPGTSEAVGKLGRYPVFAASTRLLGFRRLGAGIELLQGDQIGFGPFFAFCGVGNHDAFFRDLSNWGIKASGALAFPDHHRYSSHDVSRIESSAKQIGAQSCITTEKDAQNLVAANFESMPVYLAVIEFSITPETDFNFALDQVFVAGTGAVA